MKELSVAAIEHGTVIDHIPAGQGLRIVELLDLAVHRKQVTLGLNLPSKSMEYKDLVKVEGREISEDEANQIALIAPKATINIIREYRNVKKFKVSVPSEIERVFSCPNLRCVTNHERVITRFRVFKYGNKVELQCHFCEKSFSEMV